jgi:hypothetical protein
VANEWLLYLVHRTQRPGKNVLLHGLLRERRRLAQLLEVKLSFVEWSSLLEVEASFAELAHDRPCACSGAGALLNHVIRDLVAATRLSNVLCHLLHDVVGLRLGEKYLPALHAKAGLLEQVLCDGGPVPA